ncbi:helix-turn-helix transcriptional regulator [Methanolobus halotolerans]|nr:winged helix-turn-helix domain-containing protein [Methanolobus halotolerans]
MSDIRKDLLFLLKDGPKDIRTIMGIMDIERQPLIFQLKILEDGFLLTKEAGSEEPYKLTTIGKLLVEEMEPLMSILDFLDSNDGYWEDHRLDFIPRRLIKRLPELDPCTIVDPPFSEMYEFDRMFLEKSKVSSSFFTVTTCLHPVFVSLFLELLDKGVDISVVLSRELFEKMRSEQYSDLKHLVKNRRTEFYLYPKDMHFVSFAENDHYVQLMLLTNEDYYDNKHLMLSDPDALKWGKDFFDHYKNDSLQITDV